MKFFRTILVGLFASQAMSFPVAAQERPSANFKSAIEGLARQCPLAVEVSAEAYSFQFTYEGNEKPNNFELVQIYCSRAAYNTSQVWLLDDGYGDIRTIAFAEPTYHVDKGPNADSEKVKSITITGWTASTEISNSEFDPKTKNITGFHKWRGMADASSGGTWEFSNGTFVLKQFEVDASFDQELNPMTLVKDGKALK